MPKRFLCTPPSSSPSSPSQPPSKCRRISPSTFITNINSLLLPLFQSAYLPQSTTSLTFTPPSTASSRQPSHTYTLTLRDPQTLPPTDLNTCFKLIELTSRAAYEGSSIGWSARRKKGEMQERGMKFLVVRRGSDPPHPKNLKVRTHGNCTTDHRMEDKADSQSIDSKHEAHDSRPDAGNLDADDASSTALSLDGEEWEEENCPTSSTYTDQEQAPIEAFLSFLPTLSAYGHTAIYCYEIHLLPHLRGCGLGRHLMHVFETIGRAIGVEKAMLTVFASNVEALAFYGRLGYDVDEESPRARKLRGGAVKRADYLILSKALS